MTYPLADTYKAGLMGPGHLSQIAAIKTTADGALQRSGGTVTGVARETLVTMTASSGTYTLDCNAGMEFEAGTLSSNVTFANPVNVQSGVVQSFSIRTKMNATGGWNIIFGANWVCIGNPTPNKAANKYNVIVGKVYPDGVVTYSIAAGT